MTPRYTQTPAPRRWPSVDYLAVFFAVLVFYAVGVIAIRISGG